MKIFNGTLGITLLFSLSDVQGMLPTKSPGKSSPRMSPRIFDAISPRLFFEKKKSGSALAADPAVERKKLDAFYSARKARFLELPDEELRKFLFRVSASDRFTDLLDATLSHKLPFRCFLVGQANYTVLHEAASHGALQNLGKLLLYSRQQGFIEDLIEVRTTRNSWTPFWYAVSHQSGPAVLKLLAEFGADPCVFGQKNDAITHLSDKSFIPLSVLLMKYAELKNQHLQEPCEEQSEKEYKSNVRILTDMITVVLVASNKKYWNEMVSDHLQAICKQLSAHCGDEIQSMLNNCRTFNCLKHIFLNSGYFTSDAPSALKNKLANFVATTAVPSDSWREELPLEDYQDLRASRRIIFGVH